MINSAVGDAKLHRYAQTQLQNTRTRQHLWPDGCYTSKGDQHHAPQDEHSTLDALSFEQMMNLGSVDLSWLSPGPSGFLMAGDQTKTQHMIATIQGDMTLVGGNNSEIYRATTN